MTADTSSTSRMVNPLCGRGGCAGGAVDTSPDIANETLEAIFDALPFYFMLVDSEHTVLYANRITREALGVSPEEIVGSYCPKAVHGMEQPFPGCPLEESVRTDARVERELYDEERGAWMSSNIYPTTLHTPGGHRIYAHLVRDVSEKRRAEDAVQERAEVEALVERLATRFLCRYGESSESEIPLALETIAEFLHCRRYAVYIREMADDALTRTFFGETAAVDDREALPERLSVGQASSETIAELGMSMLRATSAISPSDTDYSLVPITLDGAISGFAFFDAARGDCEHHRLQDTHLLELLATTLSAALERCRTSRKVLEYAKCLRSMALELSAAEERERRRLAADLHDHIGQTLALSMMKVSDLRSRAGDVKTARALEEIHAHIETALTDAKSLMFELSPPVLHQFGLGAALEWLLEQHAPRYNLRWKCTERGSKPALSDDELIFLFRAAQELLRNVYKHAEATEVHVYLEADSEQVELRVCDDGNGMPPNALEPNGTTRRGFGLFSIRERLQHMCGSLGIHPSTTGGTCVLLRLPARPLALPEESS